MGSPFEEVIPTSVECVGCENIIDDYTAHFSLYTLDCEFVPTCEELTQVIGVCSEGNALEDENTFSYSFSPLNSDGWELREEELSEIERKTQLKFSRFGLSVSFPCSDISWSVHSEAYLDNSIYIDCESRSGSGNISVEEIQPAIDLERLRTLIIESYPEENNCEKNIDVHDFVSCDIDSEFDLFSTFLYVSDFQGLEDIQKDYEGYKVPEGEEQPSYYHIKSPRLVPDPFAGEEMMYEAIRLASYKDWPHWAPVQPTLLARSGFFYQNRADEVVCFSCKGKIKEWQKGDDPASEHRRWFPECPVVSGQDTENVPLEPSPEHRDAVARTLTNNSAHRGERGGELRSQQDTEGGARSEPEASSGGGGQYKYRYEEGRLKSFADWGSRYIRPADLARTGFYFLGDADRVQCAFCRGVLRNWEAGDNPEVEHKKHFPDCPFMKGRDVGNVPMVPAGDLRRTNSKSTVTLSRNRGVTNARLGLSPETAKNPNLATFEQRIGTFNNWPTSSRQEPTVLAAAGFFYAGYSDNVKCFYCDGGLRNWEPQDEAWMEHARWFPRCNFLRHSKGEQYVNDIQERYGNPAGNNATVPGQGQVEINRGNGQFRNSNIMTVNSNQRAPEHNPGASPGIEYRVDPREVKARMDTPQVRAVLSMGYSREIVRLAIDKQLRSTGDDFPNAESLLESIFRLEEVVGRDQSRVVVPAPEPEVKEGTATETPSVTSAEAKKAKKKRKRKNKKNKKTQENKEDKEEEKKAEAEAEEKKDDDEDDDEDDEPEDDEQARAPAEPLNEEETKSLMEENRELKEAKTCKVCMDEDVNTVFLPCGHLVCCGNCAPALRKCPICRAVVRGTVKIFLS